MNRRRELAAWSITVAVNAGCFGVLAFVAVLLSAMHDPAGFDQRWWWLPIGLLAAGTVGAVWGLALIGRERKARRSQ